MGRKKGSLNYKTEEESIEAIRRKHAKLMRETKWYCDVCQREYTLRGKHMHLKTNKHFKNYYNQPIIEI